MPNRAQAARRLAYMSQTWQEMPVLCAIAERFGLRAPIVADRFKTHAPVFDRPAEMNHRFYPMHKPPMNGLVKLVGILMLTAITIAVTARIADPAAHAEAIDKHTNARAKMVRTIEDHARGLPDILGAGGIALEVLDVMGEVERHLFVPVPRRAIAYADRPVSIGYGQTISQPFIVALMTHLLGAEADDAILEVGTGSGYQAAVLAPMVARVCTIEIISGLGRRAEALLADLGFENVRVKIADGYHGWPECGPFDGIVVTAAADHVPPPLVAQLKPGGRMIIPVGGVFATQYLTLIEKSASGQIRTRLLLPVRFVPLTRAGQ